MRRPSAFLFVDRIEGSIFHQPAPPGAVKPNEIPVGRVVVRGPDDADPANLEPEFFANCNAGFRFRDFLRTVIDRPFLVNRRVFSRSDLICDDCFRLSQTPCLIRIVHQRTRSQPPGLDVF